MARPKSETGETLRAFKIKPKEKIKFEYTNYNGINSSREAIVVDFWFGTTAWHPDPGIFVEAIDTAKNTTRYFYAMDMTDIKKV